MSEHALLSASGSKKWLVCTPSARLEAVLPDDASADAKDGTKAHYIMELALKKHFLGEEPPEHLNSEVKLKEAGYTMEMIDAARTMVQVAFDITNPLKAAHEPFVVMVEKKLDYSDWVPEGFGTGDLVIVSRKKVWVRDLKFGKGIAVDSEENTQMMLYGLGAYNELAFAYEDIEELDLGIVQPRIDNSSSWEVSLTDLLSWGERIKPIAQQAWEGKGEFVPGPHCADAFCRCRFQCKARAEYELGLATQEFGDLPEPNLLTDEELATLYPRLAGVEKWASTMREWITKQAVENGIKYPGLKLVEGRSTRYITDPGKARDALLGAGLTEADIFKPLELYGITELQKKLGSKKVFEEALGPFLAKPVGKPALVTADDPRQEWQGNRSADDDFAD